MSAIRKFKLKSNKNKNVVKQRVIYLGETQDNEPIFVHAETRSILDSEYNKALSKLHEEIKLPFKVKLLTQYSKEEQSLINSLEGGVDTNKLITMYDDTNPEFISKKNEIEILKTIIYLVSFFKMDETVEDENGKEVTHWEDWGINKKDGLLAVAKFVADKEKGLGMSEKEVIELQKEIEQLKAGRMTKGEWILENSADKDSLKKDVMIELDKIKEELKEVEDDGEDE